MSNSYLKRERGLFVYLLFVSIGWRGTKTTHAWKYAFLHCEARLWHGA